MNTRLLLEGSEIEEILSFTTRKARGVYVPDSDLMRRRSDDSFWNPLNIGLRKSPRLLFHYYKVYFFAPISHVAHGVLQAGRPAVPFFNSVRKSMINPAVHPPIMAVSAK